MALAIVWPADSRADDAPVELPTVSVEAQRTELEDSGVVIRVPVDPLGATSLSDLLSTLPGVQVRSAGGLGSYSEASLRGSTGRQVRILLDGLPLDTGGGEASSLSLISPLLLDEVDIYEGRVPVGLGSGLAGTINLRSRRELAAPVVASATLGSFGQRQLDVAAQLSESMQLAVGGQAATNDFPFVNKDKPYDPSDPNRTDSEDRRSDATSQYYGLYRYWGPVDVTAHVVDDRQELPTRSNAPSNAQFNTQSYALSVASPESAPWQSAVSERLTREIYHDPDSQIGLGAQDTESDTSRTLATLGRRFDHLEDTVSAEYTDYSAADHSNGVPTGSAQRINLGNGVAVQTGDERKYNAGLQTGYSRDQADSDRDHHWQFEPSVGISQRLGVCTAATNLGYRQRLPTFFERYGDRGLFKGNPDLQPESADYADLGGRCTPGDRVQRLELTFFGQDLHNAISPAYNAQGVGSSVNTSRAKIYGTELNSGGSVAGFGWQLGGTWQHTEDLSDVRASYDQSLPGRFETQLNARIERHWSDITFYYAYRLEAGQYYDSANLLKAPPIRTHDIGARGDILKMGWSVQVLNLADDHYEQFNGYPTPGRRFLLSLTYPRQQSAAPHSDAVATVGRPIDSTTPGVTDEEPQLP